MQATDGAVRLSVFRPGSFPLFNDSYALPLPDLVTGGQFACHRFEAAEKSAAVVDGNHPAVHYPPGEADRPAGGSKDSRSGRCSKIHPAVSGKPALLGLVESADHRRSRIQRPFPCAAGLSACQARCRRQHCGKGEGQRHQYGCEGGP